MKRVGRSFFAENRRVVWLGGLGLALCCFGFSLLMSGVNAEIKSSWPYNTGIARAVADPRVQRALGAPVEASWMVTGSLERGSRQSTAQLAVPLEGATKRGTLRIHARATQAAWQFERLEVAIDGASSIDLLGN